MINKDTQLYCSFSGKAGSFGCLLHNSGFEYYNINAMYKSFSITNVADAVNAMRTLNIKGAAVSMPFKVDVLNYVDVLSHEVRAIGSANTLINRDGEITACNTDHKGIAMAIDDHIYNGNQRDVYILGDGGFSKAAQYHLKSYPFKVITRKDWSIIPVLDNAIILNCTPVKNIKVHKDSIFVDCHTDTYYGRLMAYANGIAQFNLYTGRSYPDHLRFKILYNGSDSI